MPVPREPTEWYIKVGGQMRVVGEVTTGVFKPQSSEPARVLTQVWRKRNGVVAIVLEPPLPPPTRIEFVGSGTRVGGTKGEPGVFRLEIRVSFAPASGGSTLHLTLALTDNLGNPTEFVNTSVYVSGISVDEDGFSRIDYPVLVNIAGNRQVQVECTAGYFTREDLTTSAIPGAYPITIDNGNAT
jgi:hypothetical protein